VAKSGGWPAFGKLLAVSAIALFSLALGLFQLLRAGGLHALLEYDDGVWFGSTLRMVDGAVPYRDFVLDQPPLVPLLLSPVALLSHAIGAAGAFGAARIVTVGVEAFNVVLLGRLLRYRSLLCVVVSCSVLAVFPAAVVTSRTVLLEPYCDLFCLVGLLAAFDGGRLSRDRKRIVLAGVAFGAGCACKVFAVLPLVVLLGQLWANQGALPTPKHLKDAARLGLSAVASFCVICSPFFVVAPVAFVRQVVLTQLERGARAMPDHWSRVAELVGVPPAPNGGPLPDSFERIVIIAVVALVCLALFATWRAAKAPARASLERYSVVCVLVTGAGLAWPAAFYYHYAAFLAPFLALPFGIGAEALSKAKGRAIALSGACALLVVGSAHAVRAVQTVDQPDLADVAFVDRAVPAGACTVSDNPAVLLLADRFSAPGGCTDLVDADGSTLAWSKGQRGAGALSAPAALVGWVKVLEQTDYLLVTGGLTPGRIPWGPTLLGYLHDHFRMAGDTGGIVVWARAP
jgi:alpha-1,2-mannosyltransferase